MRLPAVPKYTAHHFGPDPEYVGGMATVLNMYREHGIGGDVIVHPTWVPEQPGRTLRLALASLALIVRLPKSIIVHVHLSERGSFIREGAVLVLASLFRQRTVATIHGADFLAFSEAHPWLAREVLRHAQAVMCLSNETSERVRKLVPNVKAVQIPNPVVVDDLAPSVELTAEIVMFAGEIGVRKGADVLAEAWPVVADMRPDASCVFVGPATQLEITPYERLNIRGPASSSEMVRLLREARVVVLPSRAEAMPMILIEALGAGRPFVATPVGAIPELAAHGGVLVPVDDAASLARAIVAILEQPEIGRELGARGQEYVRETRSVESVDGEVRAVYDGLFR
jgi:glycosyltransferase involved in cell wall biosynthesis